MHHNDYIENVLNPAGWTILDTKETDHGYQFVAVYAIEPLCVYCHSPDMQRFGKQEQLFLDLPMHGLTATTSILEWLSYLLFLRRNPKISARSTSNQISNSHSLHPCFGRGCATTGGRPGWLTTTPAPWSAPGSQAIGTV